MPQQLACGLREDGQQGMLTIFPQVPRTWAGPAGPSAGAQRMNALVDSAISITQAPRAPASQPALMDSPPSQDPNPDAALPAATESATSAVATAAAATPPAKRAQVASASDLAKKIRDARAAVVLDRAKAGLAFPNSAVTTASNPTCMHACISSRDMFAMMARSCIGAAG